MLFQVVRYEPKDFRQRRPNGNAGWNWYLGDTRRVPYLLPKLVKAVAAGETIYIPEGEKDVDNLRAIGLAATTNPGGIKKWRDEYSEYLRSADVVVLPDNHAEGREHAQQVVASLRGIAKRVRVLDIGQHWAECPGKGDISDWLAAGHTAEELSAMVTTLPEVAAAADDHSSAAEPPSVVNVVSVVWPGMAGAAYHGLAGEVVRIIGPHSEADPVALLVQFLTATGNLMGRTAYYQVESDRHCPNIFSVMVGDSAKARKGTSWGRVRALGFIADPEWFGGRVKGGLSSGEGLINEVRDERKEWNKKSGCEEVVDGGIKDKRLMVVEPEFASALSVAERHGNTISPIIRNAWDGVRLATLVKNSPLSATGAHISILGHVTIDELRARITRTDLANGFANRFIFVLVKRSKLLPHGGDLDERDLERLGERLREAIAFANTVGRVTMTTDASEAWSDIYGDLSAAQKGLLGAVTARAEAQVIRLALIYALLDRSEQIDAPHLHAALAVWDYCDASAAYVFGGMLGDPIADEIMWALQQAGSDGMSRTAIRDLFGRNRSGDRIGAALGLLATSRRARMQMRETGGRSAEFWFAVGGAA